MDDILKEINDLLAILEKSDTPPSKEIMGLIEEINDEVNKIKADKKNKANEILLDKLDRIAEVSQQNKTISEETVRQIVEAVENIKIEIPSSNIEVSPPKVEVNVPPIKIPEIKVPPQEVNFPEEISIKKPLWLSGLFSLKPITDWFKEIKTILVSLRPPRSVDDPISVRLSDGEKFYKAMAGMASAITGIVPFTKADGVDSPALIDEDRHIQVDVETMPDVIINPGDIEIGAVEIKNSTDDTRATVDSDGLNVSVKKSVLPTGAATESGNLTTIAGKDFATQTTLAQIKAKTDNLDTTLSGGSQQSKIKETAPTDTTKVNPSAVITGLSSSGDNLTLQKTISGINYQKTLAYTGAGPYTLTISQWTQI